MSSRLSTLLFLRFEKVKLGFFSLFQPPPCFLLYLPIFPCFSSVMKFFNFVPVSVRIFVFVSTSYELLSGGILCFPLLSHKVIIDVRLVLDFIFLHFVTNIVQYQ